MEFKDFLINETSSYLGERVGDILNALQELIEDGKSMGTRQLVKQSEGIVNQIRNILHTHWGKNQEKHLKKLQKIGVAIMKSIEEKDELIQVLQSCSEELSEISSDLGTPTNKLATPEDKELPADEIEKGVSKPIK